MTSQTNLSLCFDSQLNGQNAKAGYSIGELEQWGLCTLGHLKSFSRQYATEVKYRCWCHFLNNLFPELINPRIISKLSYLIISKIKLPCFNMDIPCWTNFLLKTIQ
jgi:hypothetical protein